MNRRNLIAGIAALPLLALPGGEPASAAVVDYTTLLDYKLQPLWTVYPSVPEMVMYPREEPFTPQQLQWMEYDLSFVFSLGGIVRFDPNGPPKRA